MVRGRKPKPSPVKKASGAYRKNPKRENKREPKPPEGWPDCPDFVKAEPIAHEHWRWICRQLEEMKILTKADFSMVALAANTYARWRELDVMVAGGNVGDIGSKGTPVTRPEAAQVHNYADRYLKLIAEVGLTPSSRSRMQTTEQKDEGESGYNRITDLLGISSN